MGGMSVIPFSFSEYMVYEVWLAQFQKVFAMQFSDINNKPSWVQQHILDRPNSDADMKAGDQYQAASKSPAPPPGGSTPPARPSSAGNRQAIAGRGTPDLQGLAAKQNPSGTQQAGKVPDNLGTALASLEAGWSDKALNAVTTADFRLPEPDKIMPNLVAFMTAAQSEDPIRKAAGHLGAGRMFTALQAPAPGMPLNMGQIKQQAQRHLMAANNLPAAVTAKFKQAYDSGNLSQEQIMAEAPKMQEQISRMRGTAGLALGNLMGNATPRIFLDNALGSPDGSTRAAAQTSSRQGNRN